MKRVLFVFVSVTCLWGISVMAYGKLYIDGRTSEGAIPQSDCLEMVCPNGCVEEEGTLEGHCCPGGDSCRVDGKNIPECCGEGKSCNAEGKCESDPENVCVPLYTNKQYKAEAKGSPCCDELVPNAVTNVSAFGFDKRDNVRYGCCPKGKVYHNTCCGVDKEVTSNGCCKPDRVYMEGEEKKCCQNGWLLSEDGHCCPAGKPIWHENQCVQCVEDSDCTGKKETCQNGICVSQCVPMYDKKGNYFQDCCDELVSNTKAKGLLFAGYIAYKEAYGCCPTGKVYINTKGETDCCDGIITNNQCVYDCTQGCKVGKKCILPSDGTYDLSAKTHRESHGYCGWIKMSVTPPGGKKTDLTAYGATNPKGGHVYDSGKSATLELSKDTIIEVEAQTSGVKYCSYSCSIKKH